MPGVRLGAFPGRSWGSLNLGLEGTLFDPFKGQGGREARGRGPGKDQGVESLNPARFGGWGERLESRAGSPRTKTGGPVGFTHAAQRCPKDLGGSGSEQTLLRRRAEGREPAGDFSRGLRSLHLPLCNRRPACSRPAPSPPQRASAHLGSSLPTPLRLLPLAFLPHFSPLFPPVPSFVFSPPSMPKLLLSSSGPPGGGERAAPGACAAQREAFLPLLPGNLERLSVRARVNVKQKGVGSSAKQRGSGSLTFLTSSTNLSE